MHRNGFRRAMAASAALHLLIALAIVVAMRFAPGTQPQHAAINTRADDVAVKLFAEELSVPVAIAQNPSPPAPPVEPPPAPPVEPVEPVEPPTPPPADPPIEPPTAPPPPPQVARTPHATAIPGPLPASMLNRIRQPRATSLRPPQPAHDSNIKPAAHAKMPATSAKPTAAPIHGTMKAQQTVVYILDCSGSMGEFGKFSTARAALIATLRRQPESVRFQVIAYNTTARPLLVGGCVAATPTNITAAETALAGLSATGRSNHAQAVRRAAELRPDVIVLLTDAENLSATAFRSALAVARKPIPLCVGRVTGGGVGAPQELK